MKKISRRSFLATSGVLAASAALTACGGSASGKASSDAASSAKGSSHEPITMLYSVSATEMFNTVKEHYPEINMEQIPYGGGNNSWYTMCQLECGIMPDIYNTSMPWKQCEDVMGEHLVELSGYPFTDNFNPTQIKNIELEGKLYLLPCNYTLYAVAYNKTLFEKHGWSIPKSFEELKALVPQIEAAGVNLAMTNDSADAYMFQYLCNLADTLGLADINGVQWQRKFLKGEAKAEEGFGSALDYMQEWHDLGMILTNDQSREKYGLTDEKPFDFFTQGNTAFYVGSPDRTAQNPDGTGDQYALMPYLSKDGTNNKVITMVSRYFGISKKLEEPGNEQKLEDALHVMEILSTAEGQKAIARANPLMISTAKTVELEPDSPFYDVVKEVTNGNSAPFIYDGWLDIIVNIGKTVRSFCNGEKNREETLSEIDTILQDSLKTGVVVYARADEVIEMDGLARLTGQALCEEVGADCALVSLDAYREDGQIQNSRGVSGSMLPVDIDEEYLVVFAPSGRKGKITTLTLTGKRIKEVQQQGFEKYASDGMVDKSLKAIFPYVVVAQDGFALEDDTEYTVVVCGVTDALKEEGNAVESDVRTVDALKDYFDKLGNPMHFTEKDIEWKTILQD